MSAAQFARLWLPVFLWMAAIFVFSTDFGSATHTSRLIGPLLRWLKPDITGDQVALVQFFVRKGGHLTEYGVLAVLLVRAIRSSPIFKLERPWIGMAFAWVGAVAYAVSDEWHQSFVATRTASAGDVVIDAVGAAVGLGLIFIWRPDWTRPAA